MLDPTLLPYAGPQTVTETALAGFSVSTNHGRGSGQARCRLGEPGGPLGWGVRRNRHHDRDVHERGRVSAATDRGDRGVHLERHTAGTSGTPAPAASTASTATTASTSAPTAAAVPQVAQTVKLAYVLSARIVALKTGRFVVVRVNGSAKTATIRVKLIGADGKVLTTVLRTVATNHAVRIANLKLGHRSTASGSR